MKTALIPVDSLDDLAALSDKIAWAKAPRAMLLWPPHGCEVRDALDFVRLRRAADRLGTQIALITRQRRLRRVAASVGIPVFSTRQAALRKAWRWRPLRAPRRRRRHLEALRALARRPWPWERLSPARRWIVFSLGLFAVLVLAAFIFPKAEITLTPQTTVHRFDLKAVIGPDYAAPTDDGHLPARWVSATVSGSASRGASGHTAFPERSATVMLTFTNLTAHPVTVPVGARVRSRHNDRVIFAVTKAGTLPGRANAEIRLPAQAVQRGETTNRPAHDLIIVEPPLAFAVLADNPMPAHGGRDRQVPAPSDDDYRRLEADLRADMAAQALAKIQQQFPHALVILPSLEAESDLERTFDPPDGQPANTLRLTLRTRYRVLIVSRENLRALGKLIARPHVPNGQRLAALEVIPDRAGPRPAREGYTWVLHVRAAFAPPVDVVMAQRLTRGRSPAAARRQLERVLPLAAPPQIRRFPSWWPLLPWLSLRIQIRLTHPRLTPDA